MLDEEKEDKDLCGELDKLANPSTKDEDIPPVKKDAKEIIK